MIVLIINDVDEVILLVDWIILFKFGVMVIFGLEFKVLFKCLCDCGEFNYNDEFINLWVEIIEYLMEVGVECGVYMECDIVLLNIVLIIQCQKNEDKLLVVYEWVFEMFINDCFLEFFQFKKVYLMFKGLFIVVDGFELKMNKGEFIILIGYLGCGKLIVLFMVVGFNLIMEGVIVFDGIYVIQVGLDCVVVFQVFSLMFWLMVYENVVFGVDKVYLDVFKFEKCDVIEYYFFKIGLVDVMQKVVVDFFNGMKQCVGIVCVFVLFFKLLLFDELFGMFDSLICWEL